MSIRYETRAGVARVTIDRVSVRNALSLETARELAACMARVDADPDVRAAVITGAGDRAFASGADLDEMRAHAGAPQAAQAARRNDAVFEAAYAAVESCRVPTIARIQGHAIGGGCFLVLACDLRIAASRVSLGVPAARVSVGLMPSELRRLIGSVGAWRAKWLIFTGVRLTAAQAQAWGLVDEVVPDAELDVAVDRVVADILRGAPLVIQTAKRLVTALGRGVPVEEGLVREVYQTVYGSADFQEGIEAFLEKRSAVFRGV